MRCPDYTTPFFIDYVLKEDIGRGDITTKLIFKEEKIWKAEIMAKDNLILCGVDLISYVFRTIDESVQVETLFTDGSPLRPKDVIAVISGNPASILTGERTVLNFLQRLSGIATLSAEYVKAVDVNSKTRITDTRKTTPGWRTLEKYAVLTGGAGNHRFGLDDGIMIKDNHIAMSGSISKAVTEVRKGAHHLLKIEVETSTLAQVNEALTAGADVIMLDNMSVDMMKDAVLIIGRKALVEISGGVTLPRINELSRIGADFISVGALTHSAVAKDINLTLFP
ncbi:MAG TPA: carboxylating nicotinate-nucleotide diphosphorylase [bacterium]|nr:carboxylating nicotinate-nucleotide diphosphorylase [bacterium]